MRFCVIALLFLSYSKSFAQPHDVKIAPKSAWVKPVTYDATARPGDGEAASSYYLLFDEQENTVLQEDYYHYAYKILTTEGIQDMSDLSVAFDPAYQTLTFHQITVTRNGAVINQLLNNNINLIQREQSMDRYLYDGSRTAVVNLRDIRVGDIVEYAFTRKGYNPVHEGHIAREIYFDVYQSVEHVFKRIVLAGKDKFQISYVGRKHTPQESERNGMFEYSWTFNKVKAASFEFSAPGWYNNANGVLISDFATWAEVGEWGKKLFAVSDADLSRIHGEVVPAFEAKDDRDYTMKVIRFVQDEVRYLGFESGINSHKPHSPLQVYEQRFGDCKDKSLLLSTLLNARGIEAYPMLVNTVAKQTMDAKLPAGNIFDHCVVQIVFEGQKIYIDPTMSNQGGTLETYAFPDYRRGLVIDKEITGLEILPEVTVPTTSEIQNFEVLTIGGEAMLSIRTVYTGLNADFQRSDFARTSLESIQKSYLEYQANLYPDITKWEDLSFSDNREENVFIVEEKYKIPKFWKPHPEIEGKIYCMVQPLSLTGYFDVPKNLEQRKSPYYLSYPLDYTHTINLKLPESWQVEPVDKIIENDFYQYECTVKSDFNEVTRMTHYLTKKDYVPIEKLKEFMTDHQAMHNNLVYELHYDNNIANANNNRWVGAMVVIICSIAGCVLMYWLYNRFDPAPARFMVRGLPIGGWLILVGIGVTLTPLRLLYDFASDTDLISATNWMGWFAAKRYGLAFFFLFSQVYNLFYLLLSVLMVVLFYQRRTSFPRLMSIQLVVNVVMLIADSLIAYNNSDTPSPAVFEQIVRPMVSTFIWVPYLNISQRVKETFVVRGPGHMPHDEDEGSASLVEQNVTEQTG